MKKLFLLFAIAISLTDCKAPEVGVLKPRPCTDIKATLGIQRAYDNIQSYYFNSDSLSGQIKEITWKVNDQAIQVLPRNRSFSYIFEKDGDYKVSVEIKDSCNQVLTLKKELNINTEVYVKPISRFVNNDGNEADIQGMSFDSKGEFKAYLLWSSKAHFYPNGSYTFKDCESTLDGTNGNIGNIVNFKYNEIQNKAYVMEIRRGVCQSIGPNESQFKFRSSNNLQTYNLGGRDAFELGTNNVFTRGFSNIILIPYAKLSQPLDPISTTDSVKYHFTSWNYKFGKFNEDEYLVVEANLNLSKYTFVKFNEKTRFAVKLFEISSIQNSIDGKPGNSNVGIGTINDLCIDNLGNIWILESSNAINQTSGFPGTKTKIRKISTTGEIKTIVTDNTPQIASPLTGNGTTVQFFKPKLLAFNPKDGNVYFSDGGKYKKIVLK